MSQSKTVNKQIIDKNMGRERNPRQHFLEVEHAENNARTLRRLWHYFAKEKVMLVGMLVAVTVGAAMSMYAPYCQSKAIDIIAGHNTGRLWTQIWLMLGAMACYAICQIAQKLLSANLSQRIVYNLRHTLFGKIVNLPISYMDRHSRGDIMSCMTNDIENISTSLSQAWPMLCAGILSIVVSLSIMFWYCWQLTLLSIASVGLTYVSTRILGGTVRRYSRQRQGLLGKLNGNIEEMVTGYRSVAAFSRQEQTIDNFCDTAERLTETGIKAEIVSGIMGPVMYCTRNLNFIVIAAGGSFFALNGMITVGTISAFVVYSKMFSRPINDLAQIYSQLQMALASAERVFNVLDTEEESKEGEPLRDDDEAEICFENVTFSYIPGKPVICDFNLCVPAGKKVALVGSTGCGKTTIANLLLRFYDLDSGRITINGQDISKISRDSLRRQIAIVLQETTLFSDTVERNLRYGRDEATRDDLERAARMSRCTEFLWAWPLKYDTVLTGAGANISQGQRQLLAIARAFVADPRILILDEATSSVDTCTEKAIQDSMTNLMSHRTSLVIAHRLSTIRDSDIIVVMDKGRIAEQGTHEELLAKRGKYYDLYMTQFAGFSI